MPEFSDYVIMNHAKGIGSLCSRGLAAQHSQLSEAQAGCTWLAEGEEGHVLKVEEEEEHWWVVE